MIGTVVALVASLTPVGKLEEMVNIGTLTAFLLVSISIPVLRKSRPDLAALVQGAWLAVGCPGCPPAICLFLMINLTVETWLRFVVWMILGFVVYFIYGYRQQPGRHGARESRRRTTRAEPVPSASLRWTHGATAGAQSITTRSPDSTKRRPGRARAVDAGAGARRIPRRRQRRGARGPAPRRPVRRRRSWPPSTSTSFTTTAPGGPPMSFVRDHYESYDAPRLVVRLLRDTGGTSYLLLHGPGAGHPVGGLRARRPRGRRTVRRRPGGRHGRRADGRAAHPPRSPSPSTPTTSS